MNEGVICNGISWQQWRIVCRDVRIVPVDGHYRRTLRFRHTGTSSSRQKTCQPTMIRAAECMPRELLLRWQKATHSNSRPPIELLRMENAAAPPTSAFYTRVYTCPSTSTPYLLLLPIPHARKPSYALTNLQRSERERESWDREDDVAIRNRWRVKRTRRGWKRNRASKVHPLTRW